MSFFSWRTSEAQLTVAEAALTPNIYVKSRLELDPSEHTYNDEVLQIANSGGAVHNTQFNVATFVRVRLEEDGRPLFVYVPLNGYYFVQVTSREPTGVLATFSGHNSNKRFAELFRPSVGTSNSAGVDIRLVTVVKVRYIDHLEQARVVYFIDSESAARCLFFVYSRVASTIINPSRTTARPFS
ncbi:hypothetical protein OKW29_004353 [Paraburkholderia sp. CI3]